MRTGVEYRLKTPTIGALSEVAETRPLPVIIPAGAVLTLMDDDVGRTGYVRVLWNRRLVTMFALDLLRRGEVTEGADGAF